MKVILSTFGPLHLIKSAKYLGSLVDIRVIQGWIPAWWNRWILSLASKLVGRNLYKSFKKRVPEEIKGRNFSVSLPEFYLWFCKLLKVGTPLSYCNQAALMYGKQSKKYIKNADIFHVRSGSGLGGAIEKAKSNGMKVVVDHSIAHPAFMDKQLRVEYEKYNEEFDLGLDNPFWMNIVEDCRKSDCVLVNSQFVKDTFVENGFKADRIRVVLLGVRKDFFRLKKDYCLPDSKFKILFTGGFGFRKGAEYILRALCKLDEENFNYEMTVVGDYSGAIPLIDKYNPKHLKLVNTVPQDELKAYLSESDVYLFPSLCEGCASSGMEAMAAGLPVIATKESGLPIENGADGIIIPSKDVDSIVRTIKLTAEDTCLRQQLGDNAANKIANNFTWKQYAERVFCIYQDLLDEK